MFPPPCGKKKRQTRNTTTSKDGQEAHVLSGVNNVELNLKVDAAIQKSGSDWDNLPENHALLKMSAKLGELIAEAGYAEMYGVELSAPTEE